MSSPSDIIIAGGGLGGLMSAVLLGQRGLSVTVIERNRYPDPGSAQATGRTAALMNSSLEMLKEAGVLRPLSKHIAPLKTLSIIDGEVRTDFRASEIDQPQFGKNIPNVLLAAELLKKARKLTNVTILEGLEIWDFEADAQGITVRLDNDTELRGKLLIGADGRNSTVRAIAGTPVIKAGYNQSAITCLISHTKSHSHTSFEIHRPCGPFTLVPMPGRTSAVVWCERPEDAETYIGMNEEGFTQALQEQTQDLLGTVTLESKPECWPLKGLAARKLTAPRVALIAEAAHALHPIGAQGLNLSLRDVKTLCDLVADRTELGLDPGSTEVMRAYRHARRGDVMTRFLGVGSLNALTTQSSYLFRRLRQSGLTLMDKSSVLRRTAMRLGLAT